MDIKFLNQPKDIKIGEVLSEKLTSGMFSRIWLFAGFAKDSGLDCLLESIKIARENGAMVECIFGVDKKNTSKDMLLKLLNLGCKIRFHINDDDSKLETRIYAFESDEGDSFIYLTGAKLSEGGLYSNIAMLTEICYGINEKKEFNKVKLSIESAASTEDFEILDEKRLKELASTGEILARITERKIPSISELYSSSEIEVGVQEYNESAGVNYNELVNKDFDIDIDFSEESNVTVQSSLGEEVEHKIKNKNQKEESTVTSKIVLNEKEINYDAMSTLILPVNKVPKKGVTAGEIKISTAISSNMNKFLNYPDEFHIQEDEKGKLKEMQKVTLKIFENLSKYEEIDEEADIIQTEKNMIIKSSLFLNIDINENDIMRLIKEDKGVYRCEIIKQESTEYNIWESFCTASIKGTSKKFGVI